MNDTPSVPADLAVVPLLVTRDDSAVVDRMQKAGVLDLAVELAAALGAEVVDQGYRAQVAGGKTPDVAPLTSGRPCVFLLCFDEHAPMQGLFSGALRWCHAHVASIPVYCYLNSLGKVPFKIRLEEIHGLNYGRPFLSLCLSSDWRSALPELADQIGRLAVEGMPYFAGLLGSAQENVGARGGNLFRLAYLRMFREDYSVAVFYAAVEYALMLMHAFAAVQAAALTAAAQSVAAFRVPRASFSDGLVLRFLVDGRQSLGAESPFHEVLTQPVPDDVREGMARLFADLETGVRLRGRTWLDFLEACVALRNATKGHGVTYFISPDSVRGLVAGLVALTRVLAADETAFILPKDGKDGKLDTIYFIDYSRLGAFEHRWMLDTGRGLQLTWGAQRLDLFPEVLYHPSYDLFFFAGTSDDGQEWYYKNHATGIYVAQPASAIQERGV